MEAVLVEKMRSRIEELTTVTSSLTYGEGKLIEVGSCIVQFNREVAPDDTKALKQFYQNAVSECTRTINAGDGA